MANAEDVNHWLEAIESFNRSKNDDAILKFQSLNPTAKIMFNIGCCFLSSDDYTRALQVSGFLDTLQTLNNKNFLKRRNY